MKLFVVLGESGEYSDRNVWVSGVYATEDEAKAAIDAAMTRRREWENCHEAYLRALYSQKGPGDFSAFTDEQQARARAAVPAEPPYEGAEQAQYFEVTLGEWIAS